VLAVGGYLTGLSVSKNMIGGVEDLEILQRLWKSGRRGLYLPNLLFPHKVAASRRRFYAALRDSVFERSLGRLFELPWHAYRQAGAAALSWAAAMARGRTDAAFEAETDPRFFAGFWQARRNEARPGGAAPLFERGTGHPT